MVRLRLALPSLFALLCSSSSMAYLVPGYGRLPLKSQNKLEACRTGAWRCAVTPMRVCMSAAAGRAVEEEVKPVDVGRMYEGFHHIELWVGNAKQAATFFMARFGFREVAYRGLETGSREVATHVVQQGNIRFAFSSALTPGNSQMSQHQARHGDGVRDVAFAVKDCRATYEEIVRRGGRSISEPREISDEHGSAVVATIATYGDTVHTLIEMRGYQGPFLPGFREVSTIDPLTLFTASPKLEFIDHVVGNQPDAAMEAVCEWYSEVMGFRRFWSVDDKQVTTTYSSLRSVVMTDEEETIKMPINEPAEGIRKSQIQEFVEYYDGPGVQHIALRTFDVIHTVETLKQRGVEFLKVPSAYYDDLERRLEEAGVAISEDLTVIRKLNILVDFDESGYLLQIFMRPIQDRPTLFLEIIQRQKHEGFGVGNFKALFEAIEREQEQRGNL